MKRNLFYLVASIALSGILCSCDSDEPSIIQPAEAVTKGVPLEFTAGSIMRPAETGVSLRKTSTAFENGDEVLVTGYNTTISTISGYGTNSKTYVYNSGKFVPKTVSDTIFINPDGTSNLTVQYPARTIAKSIVTYYYDEDAFDYMGAVAYHVSPSDVNTLSLNFYRLSHKLRLAVVFADNTKTVQNQDVKITVNNTYYVTYLSSYSDYIKAATSTGTWLLNNNFANEFTSTGLPGGYSTSLNFSISVNNVIKSFSIYLDSESFKHLSLWISPSYTLPVAKEFYAQVNIADATGTGGGSGTASDYSVVVTNVSITDYIQDNLGNVTVYYE